MAAKLAPGARQLPLHHITMRVPWHDSGWSGSICANPLENTSCLVLRHVGMNKDDQTETRYAGRRLSELGEGNLPACVAERVSFMADFELRRTMRHPYTESSAATHGHLVPTRFVQPAYSATAIPFGWMLREKIEGSSNEMGLAEKFRLGWVPEREPELSFESNWAQERDNQLALLDTFFGALRPEESLCFFYAKRTPLSEQSKRVIIGVGRVLSVGNAVEYRYKTQAPPLRVMLWERNVGHSIRPDFIDGFIFPYKEILALAQEGGVDPEELVAFAPDEHFESYSYVSELLSHDGAVASLIACAAALHRIREHIEGPWDAVLAWIDTQLNRLWRARGPFPGLGSALSAFGYEWGFRHGSLLAFEIELMRERAGGGNPWDLANAVITGPAKLDGPVAQFLKPTLRNGWTHLSAQKRALLEILSRCAIREDQALRFYDPTQRAQAGIECSDAELLANPYLLFEQDRRNLDPITFGSVDRGLFPDEAIRREFPVPQPSCVDDPADPRRVRAVVTDLLEEGSAQGHTVLPRTWVIQRARERALEPPCPLGENVLDASGPSFAPVVVRVGIKSGSPAYQIDRLVECRSIIRREVRGRRTGKPHTAAHDWRALVDNGLGAVAASADDEKKLEERARVEKAAALEQLFRSRISVLVGPAGTGKTTLLRMLCGIPEVKAGGILLLAPTGKARVRLEEQTRLRGSGQTLAQFLIGYRRYHGETGAYSPNRQAPRCGDFKTVIIDECSMLTEEQLAALFDCCTGVERFVLVGDPRQLPPIGSGRPFVDIVNELGPEGIEASFPRCGSGYAELTVPRRQTGTGHADFLLASHYSGRPLDPGADEVWDQVRTGDGERLRLVEWSTPHDLHDKIIAELCSALSLTGPDDEVGFEVSIGGTRFQNLDRAFFSNKFGDNPGAASKVDAWQMLSPVRPGLEGVDALNRALQERFRRRWAEIANANGWERKIPQPFGRQSLIYGDKVINVINQRRKDVWPTVEGEAYIANGDLGVIVGQYKGKNWKLKRLPFKLEVEFGGQLGHKYGFWSGEFGEESSNPLELAYALTVHKTQGSEFGITFVVLPNPCWLLSRELLYTALTRHRESLVVMHQGPIAEFRRFATEEYSEIARRMTNLFVDPSPREVIVGTSTRFLEEGLIHRTERGDLVRSKSELVIADKLFARGIEYAYEQPLSISAGRVRYPDFTIIDHARGVTFYWEHQGLLSDPGYAAGWKRKREEYIEAHILPYEQGGGEQGTLIETQDDEKGGLDASTIAKRIDEVFAV